MDSEKVKTISHHSNYSITSTGKVFNKHNEEKVLRKNSHGYLEVDLYMDGNRKRERVHRLVAEAFIPNPDNKPDINHKDGNKQNNAVDNLEWVTKSENMQHAYQTGLAKPHASYGMFGHKNPNAGNKGHKVKILETGQIFNSIKSCAESIGGSDRRICDCINGQQNSHLGYHFERV